MLSRAATAAMQRNAMQITEIIKSFEPSHAAMQRPGMSWWLKQAGHGQNNHRANRSFEKVPEPHMSFFRRYDDMSKLDGTLEFSNEARNLRTDVAVANRCHRIAAKIESTQINSMWLVSCGDTCAARAWVHPSENLFPSTRSRSPSSKRY